MKRKLAILLTAMALAVALTGCSDVSQDVDRMLDNGTVSTDPNGYIGREDTNRTDRGNSRNDMDHGTTGNRNYSGSGAGNGTTDSRTNSGNSAGSGMADNWNTPRNDMGTGMTGSR